MGTRSGAGSEARPAWRRVGATLLALLTATGLALGAFLAWVLPAHRAPDAQASISAPVEQPVLLSYVNAPDFNGRTTGTVEGAPEQLAGLSLLLLRASDVTVYVDGAPVASFGPDDYRAVRVVDLPAAVGRGSSESMALCVEARGLFLSYSVFLGTASAVHLAETVYYALHCVSLAALAVMFVYAVSLWAFKRDEHNLLVFAAYLGVVFLSYLIRLTFQPALTSLSYSALIATLSAFKHCAVAYTAYLLVCRNMPDLNTHLVALLAMLALSLARGLASAASLSVLFSEMTRVVLVLAAALVIAVACARRIDGAPILLVGYAPVLACEVVKASGVANACMTFSLWSYTAVFDLPFALACMLFINRRFAGRHRAAQSLADELARLNATLDARVRQRTWEADEQATRRKGLMLNVYHDLRSPLFVLKGCVDMLEYAPDEGARAEIAAIMRERLGMACGLAEDLFTLAKLEDGDIEMPMGPVRLDEVAASTVDALRIAAEAKDVRLTFAATGPCTVWGDSQRLGQVLQNLVVNAITYTPEGGSVHVALVGNDARCVLRVSDTGCGIAPDDLPHVFEKYYRAQLRDHASSTGLGLSIAKSIVERHRGTIRAESEQGCGSTFIVELPAHRQDGRRT